MSAKVSASVGEPRSPSSASAPQRPSKKGHGEALSLSSPSSPSTSESSVLRANAAVTSGEAFLPTREGLAQDHNQLMAQSPRVQLLKRQLSQRKASTVGHVLEEGPTPNREPLGTRSMNVGLNNLGNTCFMNSSLQCILHIEPLLSFFLSGSYVNDINERSPTKGAVATSFAHLLSEISKASAGSRINPQQFQKAICIYAPHLLDEQQQDCQEFLRFLLDGMSDDLFRRAKRAADDAATSASSKRNAILESIGKRGTFSKSSVDDIDTSSDKLPIMSSSAPLSVAMALAVKDIPSSAPTEASARPRSAVAKLRSITGSSQTSSRLVLNSSTAELVAGSVSEEDAIANFESEVLRLNDKDTISLADTLSVADSPLHSPDETNTARLEDSIAGCMGSIAPDPTDVGGNEFIDLTVANLSVAGSPGSDAETEALTQSPGDSGRFSVTKEQSQMRDRPQLNELNNSPSRRALTADNLKKASAGASSVLDEDQKLNSVLSFSAAQSSHSRVESVEDKLRNEGYNEIARKAARESWNNYLSHNDSIITDLFSGQLQSTVECLVCHHKSFCFDPFMDLSVPIPMDSNIDSESPDSKPISTPSKWRRKINAATGRRAAAQYPTKCTLEECISKFTADELLEGDNMYSCEKCEKRQKCVRKMAIYKCPEVLVVHIKRFQYTSIVREKLFTDVQFPISGLDMKPYLSTDVTDPYLEGSCRGTTYDLSGVVHHSGGINGGHYVAHVADGQLEGSESSYAGGLPKGRAATRSTAEGPSWLCFNDAHVSSISPKHVSGPSAYVLFYKLRK